MLKEEETLCRISWQLIWRFVWQVWQLWQLPTPYNMSKRELAEASDSGPGSGSGSGLGSDSSSAPAKKEGEAGAAGADARKRAKPNDDDADGELGKTAEDSEKLEEQEEGEVSEEGEIEEDDAGSLGLAMVRTSRAWALDLKRPPRARVSKSPLRFACEAESGKPLAGGLWLEFGVFSGKTINLMASHAPGQVFGFDTFEGLPEDWRDKFKKGQFNCDGKFPPVASNVRLVKGLFQDTLGGFLEENKRPQDMKVAVAHLDADLYSATIYALETLAPRIVPGTLLVFDELINYTGYEEHEWKALLEAVKVSKAHSLLVSCLRVACVLLACCCVVTGAHATGHVAALRTRLTNARMEWHAGVWVDV